MAGRRRVFENRPEADTPGLQGAVQRYTQELQPSLDNLDTLTENVEAGNFVITNLDPLGPGKVRARVRLPAGHNTNGTRAPDGTSVAETTALYIRTDHGDRWDKEQRFNGGIYFEVDQYQYLAGSGATKCIHRGWGDAHFVALMATGDLVPIKSMTGNGVSPIVVTTTRKHGFGHNNVYQVTGVGGNTAANREAWYGCRVLDEYRIELWDGNSPSVGNGTYTAGTGQITCINSTVGYEAAHFSENFLLSYYPTAAERAALADTIGRANGAVGFLSSIQGGFMPGGAILPGDLVPGTDVWNSGLGRNKLFEALVENDQLFSGGCFIAADTPNRAFVAHKRQFFRDTAGPPAGNGIGAFSMFVLEEAYYNPQNNDGSATAAMTRWELCNDAVVKAFALLSSAGTPTRDAPSTYQYGSYWNGAASVQYGLRHHVDVTATTPAANYDLLFGAAGAEVVKFRFKSDGTLQMLTGNLDMQSNDIVGVDDMTFAGSGSVLDMQLGQILAVADLGFRSSLQGQAADSDATTTFRDGPDIVLDGTYWDTVPNPDVSKAYGVRMRFDMVSAAPKGHLMFMFGTPPTETAKYFFHDNGNVGMGGAGHDTNNYGGGVGVLFLAVAGTEPASTPTGGGVIFVNAAGDLMYRTSAGNLRTIALV